MFQRIGQESRFHQKPQQPKTQSPPKIDVVVIGGIFEARFFNFFLLVLVNFSKRDYRPREKIRRCLSRLFSASWIHLPCSPPYSVARTYFFPLAPSLLFPPRWSRFLRSKPKPVRPR